MPAPQGTEILQFHCPIAVCGSRIAWAAGKWLVIYNMGTKTFERELAENGSHSDTIRAIAFSEDGQSVATAGEDKRVIVHSESEEKQFLHGKKIMAVHIDETRTVVFGDKFGDFYRMNRDAMGVAGQEIAEVVEQEEENDDDDEETTKGIELMFGHISAISTSLYSSKRNLLISADRDEKIRIGRYPRADIIESFLLKHRRYVSHLVWGNAEHTLLISAGADGQIIEWDISDCCSPNVNRVHQVGLDETGFHTVTCDSSRIYFVPVDDAKKLCVVEKNDGEIRKWTMPFEIQAIKNVGVSLIAIDTHSHMHVIDTETGSVKESIRLPRDVAGVPISYLKLVHHENLNGEERESKRKKKGGPFS